MKLKYVLALADSTRLAAHSNHAFTPAQIDHLADFCAQNHHGFDRHKWLTYVRDGLEK